MTGMQVAQALERAQAERGRLPTSITVDYGTPSRPGSLGDHERRVVFHSTGAASGNGFIESFNGRLRDEGLNVEWFVSLADARQELAKFREHYKSRKAAQRFGGSDAGGIRGATQASDRKN